MKLAVFLPCLAILSSCFYANAQTDAPADKATPTITSRAAGLQKQDGFIPYYWDEKKGAVLFELSGNAINREFLYFAGMGSGIGAPDMFADRSSFGAEQLCRFRRVGMRVLVIEENSRFRSTRGSADLAQSVDASFPTSVLAALPIEAEENGSLLVNANSLIIRDTFDLIAELRHPTQVGDWPTAPSQAEAANWKLDESRSVVDLDHSGSFPLNTEVEALLTFTSDTGTDLNQPDPHTLSVREHSSFVALPAPGFELRELDPRAGIGGQDFQDFSQPFDQEITRRLVRRWRVQKKDPSAELSEPVKPITFYVDRAIPEPMRSAVKRGILWWNVAFEQAGFKNAIRAEDLPEGASPMDVRYSTVQWTNRSGRGWSVGENQADLRTGEVIHAVVQLDSHRMRTANNYWEALMPSARGNEERSLDSFAAFDDLDPKLSAEQLMSNRIALLTCHEIGHALGLPHNFVASTYGRGSVMDYFAPRIKIRADGSADLSDAYMQGVGSFDRFVIEWGYSEGKNGAKPEDAQERARLNAIIQKAIAKGIVWGNYEDPRWNAYDDGPDPVSWLKDVLPVRDSLLAHYGPQMLRPGQLDSMLTSRFPLIYLFHRYALAAAIKVIGSATVPLSMAGDGQKPINIWPVDRQKEALRLVLQALHPAELEISPALWSALPPTENIEPDSERFKSPAGYLFSSLDGARAVADIVVGGLLDPQRVERLAVIAGEDSSAPTPDSVISALLREGFSPPDDKTETERELAAVVQSEIAERLMTLASDANAMPEVRAAALAGVNEIHDGVWPKWQGAMANQLKHEIELYLRNPQENLPKVKPSGAPAGPPV